MRLLPLVAITVVTTTLTDTGVTAFVVCPVTVPTRSKMVVRTILTPRAISQAHWQSTTTTQLLATLPTQTSNDNDPTRTKPPPQFLEKVAFNLGALVLLAGVVLFHELGHFLVAKSFASAGVIVDEFSIGFGPKLASLPVPLQEQFSLRVIPFGGFVSINAASMQALPVWARLQILLAGPAFNLLLATILYTAQIMKDGLPVTVFDAGIGVAQVDPQSPADGLLHVNDVILAVDGKWVQKQPTASAMEVQRSISTLVGCVQDAHEGQPLVFTVQNPTTKTIRNVSVTPKPAMQSGKLTCGVYLVPNLIGVDLEKSNNALEATTLAMSHVVSMSKDVTIALTTWLQDVLTGKMNSSEYRLSGPVRVVQRTTGAVQTSAQTQDWTTVKAHIAAASVNLGVLNLLPFPPLDGFQALLAVLSAFV